MIVAIDDNAVVNLSRLFNEKVGREFLVKKGVPEAIVAQLDLLGFSGISNVLTAIKAAKYYEMSENDILVTVLTDSMELYQSRLSEMHDEFGQYGETDAAADYSRWLMGESIDNLLELRYTDRRRIHQLKYFTWVEQQGRTYEEIQAQWYQQDYWTTFQEQIPEIDNLIEAFNADVAALS
jgi:hypothetical protein